MTGIFSVWRDRNVTYLFLGLTAIIFAWSLIAGGSVSTTLTISQDLRKFWRTDYDILVRPRNSRTSIENEYGIVESNHLSGLDGGITFDQYVTIRNLPGVEVAAPVSMIGYIPVFFGVVQFDAPGEIGVYLSEQTQINNSGFDQEFLSIPTPFYFFDGNSKPGYYNYPTDLFVNLPIIPSPAQFVILLAGIDPEQESKLIGLDSSIVEGQYLSNETELTFSPYWSPNSPEVSQIVEVPILANLVSYSDVQLTTRLWKINIPSDNLSVNWLIESGGRVFLEEFPRTLLRSVVSENAELYNLLIDELRDGIMRGDTLIAIPGPIQYLAIPKNDDFASNTIPSLELVLPNASNLLLWRAFREVEGPMSMQSQLPIGYQLKLIGLYDTGLLERGAEVNLVPLETYYPPEAWLVRDVNGNNIEPVRILPTMNPAGYVQSPPTVLTTLEVAQILRGEEAISSIRVRVGGIDNLDQSAQRKIELIATEIQKQTGLVVDVMVGSSPMPVIVEIPGIGFVKELWILKNISTTYQEAVQYGNLALNSATLFVSANFSVLMIWTYVLGQEKIIRLLTKLGWRQRTIAGMIFRKLLTIIATSATLGLALASLVSRWFNWPFMWEVAIMSGSILALGFSVGAILPINVYLHQLPIAGPDSMSGRTRIGRIHIDTLLNYSLIGLFRRKSSAILAGLAFGLAILIFIVYGYVTVSRRGLLAGTILGQYINIHIGVNDYLLLGINLLLVVLVIRSRLEISLSQRADAITSLYYLGWRKSSVLSLFALEEAILGITSGIAGTIMAMAVLSGLLGANGKILAYLAFMGIASTCIILIVAIVSVLTRSAKYIAAFRRIPY